MQEPAVTIQFSDEEQRIILDLVQKCGKCFGRGFTGYNQTFNELVVCGCVQKAYRKVAEHRLIKSKEAQ